ncbi:N-acetylmuramic acid 6-phosphate etherase [Enterococcus sp. PF1-24]|uniref:N-acetylmuramic acid 6-phosphate etherase n=1 Tax=unclassified Enterococcus TaxID=2608891 RepID=UPI0024737EDD|nr:MULTISPECIES: N-acetylmuramic acid 6-phosphate etherase [unclassified Enterococcus]MDH6364380.1 N-acetylmuramic acid 6-phosphate etherase [Enterococcus sp. PFB1-1]MDH6401431.1 N-acetylmuramic acid 6-phosphate etherase [Enterococcus sp. PF1-24]
MLEKLATEKRNSKTENLDHSSVREIIEIMNEEDKTVATAISNELDSIESLINAVINCMQNGGSLFYIGAGTSGRLGVLDAAECIPTFNTDPKLFQALIAGGMAAMTVAVEGAEDSMSLAKKDLQERHLTKNDFVLGIAASGRTPYVIGGLNYAREVGAQTGALSCNKNAEISAHATYPIEVEVGPEVLTGSTRLKAGTAQKLVLNMISTASMIRQGKAYKNLMVDVQPTNEKLVERAKRIIIDATDCSNEEAAFYLEDSDQNPKLAIVRILSGKNKEDAKALLKANNNHVREAIEDNEVNN